MVYSDNKVWTILKKMKIIEHAKQGLLNLYHSRLRSMLALLGVLVGTASVVAMVLGGELATNEALRQFKSLGTDLLAVSINTASDQTARSSGKVGDLNLSQALSLAKVDNAILQVAPYTQLFHPILYNGNPVNGMILGVTDSFASILHIKIEAGRFVSMVDQYESYCVIGQDVYAALKKISFKEPLGQSLQIGKNIFVIVGVAERWPENNFVYATIDSSVMVPIMASTLISQYASINNMIMRLSSEADIERVESHISQTIHHQIKGKQVTFRSAKELIARMKMQNTILTVFLGLIASVSLVVGGIGVMNIMLVSVVERRREIGIRLAVGAKRKDIAILFLMEAIMLSLVGGIVGVVIGIFIAYGIALVWHWQFTVFLLPPLTGFTVSVLIGIFFGFYPAYLAAKLNPIDALR